MSAFTLFGKKETLGNLYPGLLMNRLQMLYYFLIMPMYLVHFYVPDKLQSFTTCRICTSWLRLAKWTLATSLHTSFPSAMPSVAMKCSIQKRTIALKSS